MAKSGGSFKAGSAPIGRRFVKGQPSPNPGGRAVGLEKIARAKIGEHGVTECIDFLFGVMRNEKELTHDRERAAGMLLDRAIGKPHREVEISGTVGVTPIQQALLDALAMTPHERRARRAELQAGAAEPVDAGDAQDDTAQPDAP